MAQLMPLLTEIGEPGWKVGDIHLFSGPAVPESSFRATTNSIFPRSEDCTPRELPHDDRTAEALAAAGFEVADEFLTAAIAEPNGMFFTFRLLPDPGETGSSMDVASGPIIPLRLLPIHAPVEVHLNGELVDGPFGGNLGHPDCLVDGVDGISSFRQFFATSSFYLPPETDLVGQYEYRTTIRDSEGNGWDVVLPFEVAPVPEPSSIMLLSFGVLLLSRRNPR
jgi:hypothetical protein